MVHTGSVTAIGALADPLRLRLYRFVVAHPEGVSRDAAAEALGIPLSRAKFHLDRLAEEGLLEVEYRRITGRSGPGAGRPAKLYRRAAEEFQVHLPERRYDLMGGILADAVERAQRGAALGAAVDAAAYEAGAAAAAAGPAEAEGPGADAADGVPDPGAARPDPLAQAGELLAALGYEAEVDAAGDRLRLRNCPFDALAQQHRALVCAANRQFVRGALDHGGCAEVLAELDPCPGYCCVVARRSSE